MDSLLSFFLPYQFYSINMKLIEFKDLRTIIQMI